MTLTLFQNCTLIDGVSDDPLDAHHVLVEGDRIKEVSDQPIRVGDANEVDLNGRTLMPGLIDAHVHIYATELNQDVSLGMPLTLMAVRALPRLKAMLDRGFTTVRDTAGADWGIKEALEKGEVVGPRLFISGRAISQTGGHADQRRRTDDTPVCMCSNALHYIGRIADGVAEVRKAARDELRKGADQIKVMVSGGVGSPNDPIDNRQYSEEEIRAAVDEAEAWNTYVCAHSYTARSTIHALKNGVRSIEHGNLIDEEAAAMIAEKDAFMVPTLVCYKVIDIHGEEFGVSDVIMQKLRYVNEAGVRSLELCKRAGAQMGYGTDLYGDMLQYQSLEFSIRAEVLPAMEIIKSATTVNAKLLRREGELGVIAAEAIADLLVVDGNPTEDLNLLQEQGRYLLAIMQGGKFYKNSLT